MELSLNIQLYIIYFILLQIHELFPEHEGLQGKKIPNLILHMAVNMGSVIIL